jgi:hypothetical protein
MKKETKKPVVKKVKLTLEQHYVNYFNSKTIEEKTIHYNIINDLLKTN